ncbi:MAG: hypothetical protein R3F20_16670 [Planctomycetota bacterium]
MKPDQEAMQKLLGKRHDITSITKTSRSKTLAEYELIIGGVA